MMQEKDFCVFILTHGRPNKVFSYKTLKEQGYTGKIYLVVDDEDKSLNEYKKNYKDQVIVFNKNEIAKEFDEGDNFEDRRAVIYARNACFNISKNLGYTYFLQLDDDYTDFRFKINSKYEFIDRIKIKNLDSVFDALLKFYKKTPAVSIAMAQGGDFIGGKYGDSWKKPKRKCMNSFFCSTERPFKFFGRINEDVNTYTHLGSKGHLLFSIMYVALQQLITQTNKGGLTDIYLSMGTYVKSFYSVIYQPSSVKVAVLKDKNARIHHKIKWKNTVPCILPEVLKKI
jgi:hypothetical protein